MIFSPTDLVGCQVDELPAKEGPCWIGLDCGEATSGTAAAVIWPRTGACEFWFSFGDVPSLAERGRVDGARYEEMARRGELTTYPGPRDPSSGLPRGPGRGPCPGRTSAALPQTATRMLKYGTTSKRPG